MNNWFNVEGAKITIEHEGEIIDVTECALTSCGNPPKPPTGLKTTKADQDKYKAAIDSYMSCVKQKCGPQIRLSGSGLTTLDPNILAKLGAKLGGRTTSTGDTSGTSGTVGIIYGDGKTISEKKDYTKYIVIGAAVLIAGFIGYKMLKRK